MWRNIASNVLTLLIVGFVLVLGLIAWGQQEFVGEGPLDEPIFFEVPRGATLRQVSESLEAEGAVSSAAVFRIGAEYSGRAEDLKFGNYEIPQGASMNEVLEIVTKGAASTYRYVVNYRISVGGQGSYRVVERAAGEDATEALAAFKVGDPVPAAYADLVAAKTPMAYRITIAEGTTSWEVVEGLKGADFMTGAVPELPGEGLLAPDTYEVRRGADRMDLIRQMIDVQERRLAEAWALRAENLPLNSPAEALILASIVEKETGVRSEREEVAGVFVNRLNRGMRLQTDPAVIYGITNGEGPLGRGLRLSELRRETPYNTYVIPALPPTPIANPGRAAIEAALNPAETNNLYFVADGTGGHAFAETLAEHNRNVARWRQIEAGRVQD